MATKTTTDRVLTLEQITEAPDLGDRLVAVPEWGGSVRVRGLTLEETRSIQTQAMQGGELDEQKAILLTVATGMVEPAVSVEDVYRLNRKRAGTVLRLAVAVNTLTGASPAEVEASMRAFRE
jgi:hypothetical protein